MEEVFLQPDRYIPGTSGMKDFPPQGGSVGLTDPRAAAGRDLALGHLIGAYPLWSAPHC